MMCMVALSLVACGSQPPAEALSEETPPDGTAAAPRTRGEPRVVTRLGDRELIVRLELEQTSFMVSEPVFAELRFEGDEGVEVELSWMGRNSLGRPENYRLWLIDEAGQALAVPDAGPQFGGQTWKTAVHEKPARQRLFLPNWYEGISPGAYRVEVATTIRVRASEAEQWQRIELRLGHSLTVVADDQAALGEVIDTIAAVATADDYDAARDAIKKLAAIRDDRALGHWVRIAELPSYELRLAAIQALTSYQDDRAVAALVRTSETTAAELPVEGYTTEALREQSAAMLRVAAAQALSQLDDAQVLPALQRLANDPDPTVRGEAERTLRDRGE